jgi:hypothetical protein
MNVRLHRISRQLWIAGGALAAAAVVLAVLARTGHPATGSAQAPVLRATSVQFPAPAVGPSLEGGTDWLNTDKPLHLADLRGRVVLLDFWTFC